MIVDLITFSPCYRLLENSVFEPSVSLMKSRSLLILYSRRNKYARYLDGKIGELKWSRMVYDEVSDLSSSWSCLMIEWIS